jgi:hypothetical protein
MLMIAFGGWFQCRLATDPDPYDEPRGVSGYVHAYAGEPDLDRLIEWQNPGFAREMAPAIGVQVQAVSVDGVPQETSTLLGAPVRLHGRPKFEGRNGVIAEDGFEPIFPVDLDIASASVRLRRSVVPFDPDYPFEGLGAPGVDVTGAAQIAKATGIPRLLDVWAQRLAQLQALGELPEPRKTAVRERIRFLEENLARGGGAARFFGARMSYSFALNSPAPIADGLGEHLNFHHEPYEDWRLEFWLGGWDADVLCGYCQGTLVVPRVSQPILPPAPRPAGVPRNRL